MKLSIRMKIFLPVVILLIGFPLATWATLRYSLEVHMNFNARRDLEAMVRTVDGVLEEPEDGEEGDTVLSRLRDAVRPEPGRPGCLWSVRNTGWYIQKTLTTRRICPRSTRPF